MRPVKVILTLTVLLALGGDARAEWAGYGEVSGEVLRVRPTRGGAVLFRLRITGQKIEAGPQLASPCDFLYAGPGQDRLRKGVRVRMRVGGGGDPGIGVDRLESVEPARGRLKQAGSTPQRGG
jgi:hypothetical protein